MAENEATLSELIASLAHGSVDVLRKNKLAACLSVIALVGTTVLAVSSRYDERPRYRQVTLPEITRSEARVTEALHRAETTDNEQWRIFYFVDAHLKARETLGLLKRRWPRTHDGVRAHAQLIRYYELINEDMAIIRTQMSLDDKMDFMDEWRKVQARRWPIHQKWANWMNGL